MVLRSCVPVILRHSFDSKYELFLKVLLNNLDIDLRIEIAHKDEIREGKICMTIEVKELIRQIQVFHKVFVEPIHLSNGRIVDTSERLK